jgi:hypothetical protein
MGCKFNDYYKYKRIKKGNSLKAGREGRKRRQERR